MKNLFRISGVILIIILVFSVGCKKSDQGQLLEIISSLGFDIVTPNSAILSGKITSNSDSTISEWGVCWSTGHLPVITDNKVSRKNNIMTISWHMVDTYYYQTLDTCQDCIAELPL